MGELIKLKKIDYSIKKLEFKKNRCPIDGKESIFYYIGKKLENNEKKLATITFCDNTVVKILVCDDLKIRDRRNEYIIDTSKKSYADDETNIYQLIRKINKGTYSIESEPSILVKVNGTTINYYSLFDFIEDHYSEHLVEELAITAKKKYHKHHKLAINL